MKTETDCLYVDVAVEFGKGRSATLFTCLGCPSPHSQPEVASNLTDDFLRWKCRIDDESIGRFF